MTSTDYIKVTVEDAGPVRDTVQSGKNIKNRSVSKMDAEKAGICRNLVRSTIWWILQTM